MEKRNLGKTGLSISVLTFGGITLDEYDGKKAGELIAYAVDNDVNYFDSAPSYGNSQYVLGPALMPYRKDVFLACKTGKRSAEESKAELLESLSAHKTDYFDLYQLHGVKLEEIEQIFAPGGAMETLNWALEEGLTRHIGFTTHFDDAAMELLKYDFLETMLFPINYAYREAKNSGVAPLERCLEKGMGVIAIKALAERKWREGEKVTYPRTWYRPFYDNPRFARYALNYTLTRPGVTTAVAPGDERMFRMAVELLKKQGGNAIEPEAEEVEQLREYAKVLAAEDVIF